MKCPKCGNQIDSSAAYCSKCGAKIVLEKKSKHCPECGIEYHSEDKYCLKCGTELTYVVEKVDNLRKKSSCKPGLGLFFGIFTLVLSIVGFVLSFFDATVRSGVILLLCLLALTIVGIFLSAFGIRYKKGVAIPALAINVVSNIINLSFLITAIVLFGFYIA